MQASVERGVDPVSETITTTIGVVESVVSDSDQGGSVISLVDYFSGEFHNVNFPRTFSGVERRALRGQTITHRDKKWAYYSPSDKIIDNDATLTINSGRFKGRSLTLPTFKL